MWSPLMCQKTVDKQTHIIIEHNITCLDWCRDAIVWIFYLLHIAMQCIDQVKYPVANILNYDQETQFL